MDKDSDTLGLREGLNDGDKEGLSEGDKLGEAEPTPIFSRAIVTIFDCP